MQPLLGQLGCVACPRGKMSSVGASTACIECAAGWFQNASGQSACTPCAPGHFSNVSSASTCMACGVGLYLAAGEATVVPGSIHCSDCQFGTFQNLSGQSSCQSAIASLTAMTTTPSTIPSCPKGWQGKECSVPIMSSGADARRFVVESEFTLELAPDTFIIDSSGKEILVRSLPVLQIVKFLKVTSNIADFFSTTEDYVTLAVVDGQPIEIRRSSKLASQSRRGVTLMVAANTTVKDDFDVAQAQIVLRARALKMYLTAQNSTVTLSRFEYTCGEGFEPSLKDKICTACQPNYYKEELENISCTPCPANSFTTMGSKSALSVEACRCRANFRPAASLSMAATTSRLNSTIVSAPKYWGRILECKTGLQEEQIQVAVNILTAVVSTVVVTQIGKFLQTVHRLRFYVYENAAEADF